MLIKEDVSQSGTKRGAVSLSHDIVFRASLIENASEAALLRQFVGSKLELLACPFSNMPVLTLLNQQC